MIPWEFVHIPKTGGMSIVSAIGYAPQDHRRASQCSGFLATFVRNPHDRFASAFEFLRDPKWNQCVIPAGTNFREFVLTRQFETADTLYFKPMTYWLDAAVGFVGRFENLYEDYARLCRLVGIERLVPLPHIHGQNEDWTSYYDDETRTVVSEYYADDIERFGYGA